MDRNELKKALGVVMPGIDDSSIGMENCESFHFADNIVYTGNDDFCISYPLQIGDLNIAVKAKEMLQVVNKMKDKEIELKTQGTNLVVKGKKTELTLATSEVAKWLADINTTWMELPEDFWTGIKLCSLSASSSNLFSNLQVVYIGNSNMIATDKYRALWYYFEDEMNLPEVTLETSIIKEMLKIKADLKEYQISKGWIHFHDPESLLVFSSRYSSDLEDFPVDKIKNLFPDSEEAETYEFPSDIKEALDITAVISYEDEESGKDYISLEKKGKKLICYGEKEFGSVKHSITIDKAFPDKFHIQITPVFLKSILEHTNQFAIVGDKVLFETETFAHIIATI